MALFFTANLTLEAYPWPARATDGAVTILMRSAICKVVDGGLDQSDVSQYRMSVRQAMSAFVDLQIVVSFAIQGGEEVRR